MMDPVTVEITPEAAESAAQLPKRVRAGLLALIEWLEKWPHVSGAKPLLGKLAGRYRMRSGDYRLQFHLDGRRLVIEKIGHRDGFYED